MAVATRHNYHDFNLGPEWTKENISQLARAIKTIINGDRVAKLDNGTGIYSIVKGDIEWTLSAPRTCLNPNTTLWRLSVAVISNQPEEVTRHWYQLENITSLLKRYHLERITVQENVA